MTQLRRVPSSISNFFDRLLTGIGHRGSSFTDVDALTHDEATDRFLFQEFKNAGEALNRGQARLLKGLARRDFATVWCVRRLSDDTVEWCDVATREHAILTAEEYRSKFRAWWANEKRQTVSPPPIPDDDDTLILADSIRWG